MPLQNLDYIATVCVRLFSTGSNQLGGGERWERLLTGIPGQIFLPFEMIYDLCIVTAKLSVLFFYLRVFNGMVLMQRLTKGVMALIAIWGTANLLQSILVCRVSVCTSNVTSLVSTGLFNCTTNVIINLLPLYTIWSLNTISVSTRFGLTVVFLFSVK